MAYVKLDTGVLDSTLWTDRDGREVFITALLMAVPHELTEPTPSLHVRSLEPTGFVVPAGWYGRVAAAGVGIARRAGIETEAGLDALERLAATDAESRTPDFDGRRLVRVDGGYLILNFMAYRDRDTTAAERQQRYRDRHKGKPKRNGVTVTDNGVTSRNVTQEEEEGSRQEAVGSKQEVLPLLSVRDALPPLARPAFDALAGERPDALARALQSLHAPLTGGAAYSWDRIGQSLIDYEANTGGKFSARLFKGYLERDAREPAPRRGKPSHDDTDAAIAEGLRRLNAAGVNGGE